MNAKKARELSEAGNARCLKQASTMKAVYTAIKETSSLGFCNTFVRTSRKLTDKAVVELVSNGYDVHTMDHELEIYW